jgi:phosphoribosylformylglycinamidine synthase
MLLGEISQYDFNRAVKYCINPVESREASLDKPLSLRTELDKPGDIQVMTGFTKLTDSEIEILRGELGLAMSDEDLRFCRDYFKDEGGGRDPFITEIRVIDTYWSDHCRHTTFLTKLNEVRFSEGFYSGLFENTYNEYLNLRKCLYEGKNREICLMDIATIAMKDLLQRGILKDLDESDEINACSIKTTVNIDGVDEDWLVMFKNETHNHPTEIEPFGGAATCLGGAIRDPLSGRTYVYQAMRVTGSGDPTVPYTQTLKGKLPQRKITTGAASGYSSYGNQIGLATGQVSEVYHPGYVAKRMEIGAVIAAAPAKNVVRETPSAGDMIILLGGRTGRDGIGGATGSSKEHNIDSVLTCGSEVQKGNPPTERKLQRLFRNPEVGRLIKRCNDFGAGGVCVAIGELAPGIDIDLDCVPKKYEGMDGTELAISESQERMAVVVAKDKAGKFIDLAAAENLEAVKVAAVNDSSRLRMFWRNEKIVDISREFLDTNGVRQNVNVTVTSPEKQFTQNNREPVKDQWFNMLSELNSCSQKGLVERFDSTVGANTVMLPFGGKFQLTPTEGCGAKIPVLSGETEQGTLMTYGFDPYISEWSPFHGAVFAIVESLAKLVAMGGSHRKAYLTFQEYFERLGTNPEKWGKPVSALLGAFYAQKKLGIAAIGGKDSMSGTFMDMNVPPTLVSFAVNTVSTGNMISPEFKQPGSRIGVYFLPLDKYGLPDFESLHKNYTKIENLIENKQILSAMAVKFGGIAETLSKMCFGNKIGVRISPDFKVDLFEKRYGSIVFELSENCDIEGLKFETIGRTIAEPVIETGDDKLDLDRLISAWEVKLEEVFPSKATQEGELLQQNLYNCNEKSKSHHKFAKPRVIIPVFPGNNCEYESFRAFEKAGALPEIFVVRNLNSNDIEETIINMSKMIDASQIIMLPGGFSGGDEPDGSGKFIATMFRNHRIKEAVMRLLNDRDGLMLGICNGFQALIKLGLVPYGEIRDIKPSDPTLTFNSIGRHVSRMVNTKIISNKSPWLYNTEPGDIHTLAVSHGEGRFIASYEMLKTLSDNGQITTQYVDFEGNSSMDIAYNPNGSVNAVEGIASPDGRILGKMGHSERIGKNICINVPGEKDQKLFESGVKWFW